MQPQSTPSDVPLLNLLRKRRAVSIGDLTEEMGVTATAVRQRLTRLTECGLVQRELVREGRGRPSHHYLLTKKGLRAAGDNYAELAEVLWTEIVSIDDHTIRDRLVRKVASQLASRAGIVSGETLVEKMQHLVSLMGERRVPFEIDTSSELPVLTAVACPYPDLVEKDRTICKMEKLLFTELLGQPIHQTDCRPDGDACCSFTTNNPPSSNVVTPS